MHKHKQAFDIVYKINVLPLNLLSAFGYKTHDVAIRRRISKYLEFR